MAAVKEIAATKTAAKIRRMERSAVRMSLTPLQVTAGNRPPRKPFCARMPRIRAIYLLPFTADRRRMICHRQAWQQYGGKT
ncbi:MAG: hypothetical protein JNM75_08075 [Rhodospirillales bacterium]|nr:hypothetical protein [Rhodospirillales bacterium]